MNEEPQIKPTIFKIRTLRDIYNLPTRQQMETCLKEISQGLIQARLVEEAAVTLANDPAITRAFDLPEELEWTDDGKGEVQTDFHAEEQRLFGIKTTLSQQP